MVLAGLLLLSTTATAVFLRDAAFASGSTFSYTGHEQTYTVPPGVTSVTITALGATGGSGTNIFSGKYEGAGAGGEGALVTATVPVSPGQVLYVEVGGPGGSPSIPPTTQAACAVSPPAFNGGGTDGEGNCGGGGGGASDVRTCSMTACPQVTPDTRLVVAGGGGGGAGGSMSSSGGNGGNAGDSSVTGAGAGGVGCDGPSCHGGLGGNGGFGHPPGSSPCGGVGSAGQGGGGACGTMFDGLGGGGGGGYDGGGEGGNGNSSGAGGGGGAGSSYWIPGAVSTSMTDPVGPAMVNIVPGPAAGGSQVHAVIQVETSPSFAGDTVNISSLQLENACGGLITFETLQGGSTTAPRDSLDSITVNLDDDGNVTVVVDGFDCAPGNDLIEADLTAAPYLTATTVLDVEPPQVTAAGISATPANEVETGNDTASGNSDVYTVFYVETDPVYAGQPVMISSPQLENRCSGGWRWEPASGTTIDQTSGPTAATGLLDNDGNAVFVFKGASCAPGTSTVIADVEAGSHTTYSTNYTIDAPAVTAGGRLAGPEVRAHHHHHHHHHHGGTGGKGGKGGTGGAPGSGLPAMTVTASPNPLVETGGPMPSAPTLQVVKSDNYGGSSSPPNSVDLSSNDGTITYTITVSNSGSTGLDGVVVSDPLSANPALADDTFTASETGGASGFTASATAAGFNDINDIVDLPGDSSITYTVVADLNNADCNFGIANTVNLTPPAGVTLGASSNTSATDSDTGFIGAC